MARTRCPLTPGQAFLRLFWRQPLWAIPFALFFFVMGRGGWKDFLISYEVSLIFAFTIGIALWTVEHFLWPRLKRTTFKRRQSKVLAEAILFPSAAFLASYVAAIIVHFTIVPGLLGGFRQFMMLTMFSLIFVVLVTGIIYMISYHKDSIERVRAEEELNLARRIQRSFLLSRFPTMPHLEVHALNVSSKHVSGDFYDVVPAGPDAFLIAIADVAGKGVPAALLSSALQASLRTQATSGAPVSTVLANINALVYRSTAVDQFATFFLARVEEQSLRLSFSNAGHNYPILFRRNGERILLDRGGVVLGILEDSSFEEESLTLEPGDRLVLYSDGISEAFDRHGEPFGEERLYDLVASLPLQLKSEEVIGRIFDRVREHLGAAEPSDDMTILVLRVLERDPAAMRAIPAGSAPALPRDGAVSRDGAASRESSILDRPTEAPSIRPVA